MAFIGADICGEANDYHYDEFVHHPRLSHPALDFWIDVRLREFDGRWLEVADHCPS